MSAMEQSRTDIRQRTVLLDLAEQLRDAARSAGRADVVVKADEIIASVARETDARSGEGPRGDRKATGEGGNTVIRVLDGLGF
jgi:hypothetical protein